MAEGKNAFIRGAAAVLMLVLLLTSLSCCVPGEGGKERKTVDLSENREYTFSGSKSLLIGENDGVRLTAKGNTDPVVCTLTDVPLTFGDWYGNTHETSLFEEKEGCWYVCSDFGFPAEAESFSVTFSAEYAVPERVEVYLSDDGYNFNRYAGDAVMSRDEGFVRFTLEYDGTSAVKAVRFYVFTPVGTRCGITGINCTGVRLYDTELISAGADFSIDTPYISGEASLLNDGAVYGKSSSDGSCAVMSPSASDELTGKRVINAVLDLGKEKNISEVILTACEDSGASRPDFVSVKYSSDGENWEDFCMSFAESGAVNASAGELHHWLTYAMRRNHTVTVRYIKVQVFTEKKVAISEIAVYGCTKPVAEPEYSFPTLKNAGTALDASYTFGGQTSKDLSGIRLSAGVTEISADTGGVTVTSAAMCISGGIDNISFCGEAPVYSSEVAGMTFLWFRSDGSSNPVISVNCGGDAEIRLCTLYSGGGCLPIIRGGFYSFFIDAIDGYNPHHYFDSYRIYIQLKGFRELGMDTVILSGQNLMYEEKTTLIDPPEELAAKGYKKGRGHGVYDLNEAVLAACDSLGINAYLSTVLSLPYSSLPAGKSERAEYLTDVLADAEIIIRSVYDRYSHHQSFTGFYLVDETCDAWLAQEKAEGTTYTRDLYAGQSEVIRELDEKLLIAIAPAAWRSDTPEGFGKNLYELIKSDTEGGRPIVDVVAVQDCLGREADITVSDSVYTAYTDYLRYCASGVRTAGAEFMNDTEIFDIGYRIKRSDEILRSVTLESTVTSCTLVFDLTHYFSAQGRGDYDRYPYFDNDYIVSRYAKYLSGFRGRLTD